MVFEIHFYPLDAFWRLLLPLAEKVSLVELLKNHKTVFEGTARCYSKNLKKIKISAAYTLQIMHLAVKNDPKEEWTKLKRSKLYYLQEKFIFLWSTKIQSSLTRIFKYDNGTWLLQNDIHILLLERLEHLYKLFLVWWEMSPVALLHTKH